MDNIHKIKHHRQAVTVPPTPQPVPIRLEEWRTQGNGAYHLELIHFFGTHLERKKTTSFYRHRHHLFYPKKTSKCFIKTTPRPDAVTHMPFSLCTLAADQPGLQSKLQDCTETLPTSKRALCLLTHEIAPGWEGRSGLPPNLFILKIPQASPRW